ncbi:hypothetical protein AAU61_09945 [Desulfocarbo indianensis]|nr:hypothetical protein AAU61_09945 [Desulfocarbo indianensis]
MERVRITLIDSNLTPVFDTELTLEPKEAESLNSLLCCVQDGLYCEHEHRLSIRGVAASSVDLVVTSCERC